ncbi:hypothetical protein CDL15_Pgr001658 [Punica granatum]|uniref:RRM domain-containing protein n=1 Tax=Punica granatum TaxID=22663 RepID=A0A218XAX1_PUNGR|nr:hypothetical protein CDL15_Pgr001658 [Punica granatum]PKI44856.1 hypothetical protein CRG98_034804 [Punica granatum]
MAPPEPRVTVTLRITSLPLEITKDILLEHFGKYGTVSNVVIIKHPEQKELSYAFLRFHDSSQTEEVLREENHVILNQEVNVAKVSPVLSTHQHRTPINPKKLFIGGLPPNVTVKSLMTFFARYGKIVDCFIPSDRHTGQSRRFGFVEFQSEESVNIILNGVKNKFYQLGGRLAEVKRAIPQ